METSAVLSNTMLFNLFTTCSNGIDYHNISFSVSIQFSIWMPLLRSGHRQYKPRYYSDVIMGTMAFQITSFTIVYSTVYSGASQRKHQRFASLAFVRGNHRSPVISPHKWPVREKCLHLMTSSWDEHPVLLCLYCCGYIWSYCEPCTHMHQGCVADIRNIKWY